MDGSEIRPARRGEHDAVAACVKGAYAKYVARIGRKPAPMLADYAALIAAGAVFVIAAGAEVRGVLVLRPAADHLLVENVAVRPADQGLGLGRRLMGFAEVEAARRGLPELRLYTHELMSENLAFYPRLGYEETGRRTEDGYQRVFFRKRLSQPSYPSRCWLDPRVAVASSGIEGRGLFARAPIREGEVVMRLGGRVLTDDELKAFHLVKYSSLAIGDHRNLLLDDDGPVNFGNHSCDANLWMSDEVTLTARRDIAPGEEVTVDYALHTADLPWRMVCRCGSPHCRGVVTNEDWRRRDVQERYSGHFSPFLNARIAGLRRGGDG